MLVPTSTAGGQNLSLSDSSRGENIGLGLRLGFEGLIALVVTAHDTLVQYLVCRIAGVLWRKPVRAYLRRHRSHKLGGFGEFGVKRGELTATRTDCGT